MSHLVSQIRGGDGLDVRQTIENVLVLDLDAFLRQNVVLDFATSAQI